MKHPKHFIKSFTLICLAISSVSVYAQQDVSKEIMAANANFERLFNAGDVDEFLTLYTDDARVLPPNGSLVTGKDALREMWSGMMEMGITPKLTTTSAVAYGKVAIEEGTATIMSEGQVVDNSKYIVIWHKEGKDWKMHQDIWNSSNPPAGH